jgi:hypothetical protein
MTLHNRYTSRFIKDMLDARGWTESKLAKESGVSLAVISDQLWSGKRRIRLHHLKAYMSLANHQERPKLLALWLRENFPADITPHLLNEKGDDLAQAVKEFVPALEHEDKQMLSWLSREMARDGELGELFRLLSARAGYRPKRNGAGPAKKRRDPPQKLSAFVAFIVALFNNAAPIEHQAHMAALIVPTILAASEPTTDESADFLDADWQRYQASAGYQDQDVPEQHPRKREPKQRPTYRQQPRGNLIQRLADKTVNPELRRLRRVVRRVASR